MKTVDKEVKGFNSPTELPQDASQDIEWQERNRQWWENHPMRYDWKQSIAHEEFSPEFYQEIDQRFFASARQFMPWQKIPFDPLIDFAQLANQDVLEIGVGNGSHAQLLASHAKSYTGIDITEYAVKSTTKRMECFGLKSARIIRMDAEHMNFSDDSFDYIWSWGVIHHSADTAQILGEMRRVLRPGGTAVTMVYHRSVWNYYVISGFLRGFLRGDLWRIGSVHKILQHYTDGAIARFYSINEWRTLVQQYFDCQKIFVVGARAELFPLPGGKIKDILMARFPGGLCRFFTNRCRFGGFLVSVLKKK